MLPGVLLQEQDALFGWLLSLSSRSADQLPVVFCPARRVIPVAGPDGRDIIWDGMVASVVKGEVGTFV